jgi:hypothetical protein
VFRTIDYNLHEHIQEHMTFLRESEVFGQKIEFKF